MRGPWQILQPPICSALAIQGREGVLQTLLKISLQELIIERNESAQVQNNLHGERKVSRREAFSPSSSLQRSLYQLVGSVHHKT